MSDQTIVAGLRMHDRKITGDVDDEEIVISRKYAGEIRKRLDA